MPPSDRASAFAVWTSFVTWTAVVTLAGHPQRQPNGGVLGPMHSRARVARCREHGDPRLSRVFDAEAMDARARDPHNHQVAGRSHHGRPGFAGRGHRARQDVQQLFETS